MLLIPWALVFGLGCYAQTLVLDDRLFTGLILYLIAGVLSYLILTVSTGKNTVQHKTEKTNGWTSTKEVLYIPLIAGLLCVAACVWLIREATLAKSYRGDLFSYGLYCWLAFWLFTAIAIHRPFFTALRKETWRSLAPLGGLLLLALLLNMYRLTTLPITVHGDEGMVGVHARYILYGKLPTFFSTSWYSIPQFFFSVPAGTLYLFGDNLFGFRMSAVLVGALSVIPFYFLTRWLWGTGPAIVTTFLLITNHWILHLSHSGVNYVQALFFTTTLLALWFWTYEKRSMAAAIGAGAVMGLALLSYQANHLLPLLWLASQIGIVLLRKISFRWFVLTTLVPLALAFFVISPLLTHDIILSGSAATYSSRAQGVIAWTDHNHRHLDGVYKANGDPGRIWQGQIRRAYLAPIRYSDTSMQYAGEWPFLDRTMAVFFMLGIVTAAFRFFDPRWSIPVVWICAILTAGGVCTVDAPFYPRLTGTSALYFLPIAGVFAGILRLADTGKVWKWSAIALIAVAALMSAKTNLQNYFIVYANEISPNNIHYPQTQLGYLLAKRKSEGEVALFSGPHLSLGSGTVQFLVKDTEGITTNKIPPGIDGKPFTIFVDSTQSSIVKELKNLFPNAVMEEHRSFRGQLMFTTLTQKGSSDTPPTNLN